jgi:hypothetical protein
VAEESECSGGSEKNRRRSSLPGGTAVSSNSGGGTRLRTAGGNASLRHDGDVGEASDPGLSGRHVRRSDGRLRTAGRDDGFMPTPTASGSAAPLSQ